MTAGSLLLPSMVAMPPVEFGVEARAVVTPVPKPVTPESGIFVALDKFIDEGVPAAPPLVIKAPEEPTLTPSAVPTPVPRPPMF